MHKNGIIKGEYGFITADDVYHVTVYATDEQGRFKILSMKNIRYRDYKGLSGPPTATRQGHSLQLPPQQPETTSQKSTPVSVPTTRPALNLETISIEPPANSCSHCSIPTTSTAAPKVVAPPINPLSIASSSSTPPGQSNSFNAPVNTPSVTQPYAQSQGQYPSKQGNSFSQNQNTFGGIQGFAPVPQAPEQQNNYIAAQNTPQQPSTPLKPFGSSGTPSFGQGSKVPGQIVTGGPYVAPVGQQIVPGGQQITPGAQLPTSGTQQVAPGGQQFGPSGQQNTPNGQQFTPINQQNVPGGQPVTSNEPQVTNGGQQIAPNGQQYQKGIPQINNFDKTRTGKQYKGSPNPSPSQNSGLRGSSGVSQPSFKPNQTPTLAYAQMQIVDKNTDIKAKRPGEKDGLPPGIKEDDMLKLLYTFNYTLGFQAHFEEGYTNGEKRGYYYTTGRNGVRTRIDYVADENGFRPTISQEVYDLLSDDVPKEDTEKEERYGLKGYEFKWLYFPPDTSSQ